MNHRDTNLAVAFAAATVVTSGSGNATFRVGSEVGDDTSLASTDTRTSTLGNASKLNALITAK